MAQAFKMMVNQARTNCFTEAAFGCVVSKKARAQFWSFKAPKQSGQGGDADMGERQPMGMIAPDGKFW